LSCSAGLIKLIKQGDVYKDQLFFHFKEKDDI
jgi:hypothetical protein